MALREEHILRMFENRCWRDIFGPTKDEVIGALENYIMKSFIAFIPCLILLEWWRQRKWDGQCMLHAWEKIGMHTVFRCQNLKKSSLGKTRRRWKNNSEMDLKEIGRGCELSQDEDQWRALVDTKWNFVFHKILRISWVTELTAGFSRTQFRRVSQQRHLVGWLVNKKLYECGMKQSCPTLRYYTNIRQERLRKTTMYWRLWHRIIHYELIVL
jgi:hypothetical protein